jgi:RNA polymerase sigma-70 factor (ECF subfamily)
MHQASVADSSEVSLMKRARAGDHEAFAALVEPYRRRIHVHCYRMLGSLTDAEDMTQEALLRAWRALDRFEGRSSFRGWLYRIAINACLDELKHRRRRILPDAYAESDDPDAAPAPPLDDVPWIEPYLDHLLDGAGDPARRYEARETTTLAFVATVQRLSPRQRAILILRDALGFSAGETAAILETTQDAVNAGLRRARLAVGAASEPAALPTSEENLLVSRYVDAWEGGDVKALVELLSDDGRMTMPPSPSWYLGREAIGAFLAGFFDGMGTGSRLLATRANGQPAVAVYVRRGDRYAPLALQVLTIEDGRIETITGFTDTALFPFFAPSERHDLT